MIISQWTDIEQQWIDAEEQWQPTEEAEVVTTIIISDVSSGSDSILSPTVALNVSDAGQGTTNLRELSNEFVLTDSGGGTDVITNILSSLIIGDSGSGADSIANISHALRDIDETQSEFQNGTLTGVVADAGGYLRLPEEKTVVTTSFEYGFTGWSSVDGYNEWRRNSGETPTANTGPPDGLFSDYYIYVETSEGEGSFESGDETVIEYDMGELISGVIECYQYRYGDDLGTLYIDVFDGSSWTTRWSGSGENALGWFRLALVFDNCSKIRFRNVAAGGDLGDVAIDLVGIYKHIKSGNRLVQLDLSTLGLYFDSLIKWTSTVPTDTSLTIETRYSLDNGLTWSDWQICTNGDPIPGLSFTTNDLSNALLECRETFSTEHHPTWPFWQLTTPELSRREIYIAGTPPTIISVIDVGSGSDLIVAPIATLNVSDAGQGITTLGDLTNEFTLTDSGSGIDSIASISKLVCKAVQDSASGVDSVISPSIELNVTDTGLGTTEISGISVNLAVSDDSSASDIVSVIGGAVIRIQDSGVGTDIISNVNVDLSVFDSAMVDDTIANIINSLTIQDTGLGTDTTSFIVEIQVSDGATASDTVKNVLANLSVTDSGVASDTIENILANLSITDDAVTSDTVQNILAELSVADASTAIESISISEPAGKIQITFKIKAPSTECTALHPKTEYEGKTPTIEQEGKTPKTEYEGKTPTITIKKQE